MNKYNKVVIRYSNFVIEFCFVHKIRNEKLLKKFGKNLQRIRKAKGMTQEYLAEEAKISQIQVARLESGKLNTSISTLYAISKALSVSMDEFFD